MVRLGFFYYFLTAFCDDVLLGFGERLGLEGLEGKIVSDFSVAFHFLFREHIEDGFGVGVIARMFFQFVGYFLFLFLLFEGMMAFFGVSAFNTLDGFLVVADDGVFALFAHPVLEKTDSL